MKRPKLGVNTGKSIDANKIDDSSFGVFQSVRVFQNIEEDYIKGETPKTSAPDAPKGGWGRMNNGALRWSKLPKHLDLTIALQHFQNKQSREWTEGFWSASELGDSRVERVKSGYEYGLAFFRLYENIANRLHLANEAWSEKIGYEALGDWISGIILAHRHTKSNIALSLPSMRYDKEKYGKDFIDFLLPETLPYLYDIDIHLYSFKSQKGKAISYTLTDMPEAETSDFKHIYDVVSYRDAHLPNSKIISSEQGYDSDTVGELGQAAYCLRHYFLLWSLGVYQVDFYEYSDNPYKRNSLYGSSGWREAEGNNRIWGRKKLIWEAFEKMQSVLKGAVFVKSWQKDGFIFHEYEKQAVKLSEKAQFADKYVAAWKVAEIQKTTSVNNLDFELVEVDFKVKGITYLLDVEPLICRKGQVYLSALPTIFKLNSEMAKEIIKQPKQEGSPKGVNMYGIEETIEFLNGVAIVTDSIEEALADDGKISGQEGLKIALSLIVEPKLFEAVQGAQEIPKELFSGDLTESESERLRSEGLSEFTDNPDIQAAIFGLSIFVNSTIRFVKSRKQQREA